ncbi:SDR family oxidoreductase [Natrinema caseinilyticum]|uniref:SDR family oxidoreductase n=1 Tax=Natrinema caseinilyticum TaxID=2961570 RepID=UPI0020C302B8|nr:SDR family oxidoreductase [Natrinema caseinilyticum]
MDLGLDGHVALVTASSSGLGKAAATALAREGANVVINGRDETRLAEAAEEIRAVASGEVVAQPGDLTDPEDIETLVSRPLEEFGRLDHLVTSAGGPTPMRPLEPSDEEWYEAYDLLTMSVVRLVREAADHLRSGDGGSIVAITSIATKRAGAGNVLSNSVRTSVVGFEKTLAKDLGPEVRANAVLPGVHETPRLREVFDAAVEQGEYDSYEDAKAARVKSIPTGQIGDPTAFGDTVAFLCSGRASHINGAAVPIDGGESDSIF